jgi:hypothetical protein
MACEEGPEDRRDPGDRFARDLPIVAVSRLEALMPFLFTEEYGDSGVRHHEVARVRASAAFSSIEEDICRDRGDGGAKERDPVVQMDADGG